MKPGDRVLIDTPGHRMHGETGTLIEPANIFRDGWIVNVNGDTYGFFANELKEA